VVNVDAFNVLISLGHSINLASCCRPEAMSICPVIDSTGYGNYRGVIEETVQRSFIYDPGVLRRCFHTTAIKQPLATTPLSKGAGNLPMATCSYSNHDNKKAGISSRF
jgi:hypothetical protein